jgi:hypothetical protein
MARVLEAISFSSSIESFPEGYSLKTSYFAWCYKWFTIIWTRSDQSKGSYRSAKKYYSFQQVRAGKIEIFLREVGLCQLQQKERL